MPTRPRKYEIWLDFVQDLVSHPSASFPSTQINQLLAATFDCLASWTWVNADGSFGAAMSHPIPNWPSAAEYELWREVGPRLHPLLRWYRATGDPWPMTIGRVPRTIAPRAGADQVREWFRPVGLEQQLSIPCDTGRVHHRAFVLGQTGTDFSAEALELARRIQPLIALVSRQTTALRVVPRPDAALSGVTGREVMVLQHLADGLTAQAIAHRLGLSPRTVHTHLRRIYRKLGVSDRLRAVMVAQEAGLLPACRAAAYPICGLSGTPGAS